MLNQAKATPRPWTFEKHIKNTEGQELKWYGNIVGHYGDNVIRTISCQCRYGTEEENEANASLIVKAVNSFDKLTKDNEALLAACREALKALESGPDYDAGVYQLLTRAIANAETNNK